MKKGVRAKATGEGMEVCWSEREDDGDGNNDEGSTVRCRNA